MDGWWDEIDREIRGCLERYGAMTPGELGDRLGLSEHAVSSLLSFLASEGKLKIARVEPPESIDHRQLSLLGSARVA